MSEYFESLEKCDRTIFDLWGAINDLLPDMQGNYLDEWSLSDCEYLHKHLHITADTILSTVMYNHCAYEIHCAMDVWDKAFEVANKTGDVSPCKAALDKCYNTFHEIRIVCQKAKPKLLLN